MSSDPESVETLTEKLDPGVASALVNLKFAAKTRSHRAIGM